MSASVAARIAAGLLGVVMLFQLAVAVGAPWGGFTQGGGTEGTLSGPGRLFAVGSFLLLLVMALALLARAGEGPLRRAPRRLVTVLAWLTLVYLALAVALNLATPSMRERIVWAPLTIVTFACAVVVMVRTARHRPALPAATERLSFRQWEAGDAAAVLDIYGRPDVYRFLGSTPTPVPDLASASERIRRWRSLAAANAGIWAVLPRSGPLAGRPVGSILLLPLTRTDGARSDVHEIGWHLHPDAWGQGLATEAAAAVIELARRLGLPEVRAVVIPANGRSVRVCERLGMTGGALTEEWYGIEMREFVLPLDDRPPSRP